MRERFIKSSIEAFELVAEGNRYVVRWYGVSGFWINDFNVPDASRYTDQDSFSTFNEAVTFIRKKILPKFKEGK